MIEIHIDTGEALTHAEKLSMPRLEMPREHAVFQRELELHRFMAHLRSSLENEAGGLVIYPVYEGKPYHLYYSISSSPSRCTIDDPLGINFWPSWHSHPDRRPGVADEPDVLVPEGLACAAEALELQRQINEVKARIVRPSLGIPSCADLLNFAICNRPADLISLPGDRLLKLELSNSAESSPVRDFVLDVSDAADRANARLRPLRDPHERREKFVLEQAEFFLLGVTRLEALFRTAGVEYLAEDNMEGVFEKLGVPFRLETVPH